MIHLLDILRIFVIFNLFTALHQMAAGRPRIQLTCHSRLKSGTNFVSLGSEGGCQLKKKRAMIFMINMLEDLQKFPALGLSSWAAMFAHSYKKPSALSG